MGEETPQARLIALIQDAKGIIGWALGKSFAQGDEYWVQRISAWQDAAHNDVLSELEAGLLPQPAERPVTFGTTTVEGNCPAAPGTQSSGNGVFMPLAVDARLKPRDAKPAALASPPVPQPAERPQLEKDDECADLGPLGNWHAIEGPNGQCACGPDEGCPERLRRWIRGRIDFWHARAQFLWRERDRALEELPDYWQRAPGSLAMKIRAYREFVTPYILRRDPPAALASPPVEPRASQEKP